jgi:hypothetical protein
MGWSSRFGACGEVETADRRDPLSMARRTMPAKQSEGPSKTPQPAATTETRIAEEIKRRQVSLALRYVAAVRAR